MFVFSKIILGIFFYLLEGNGEDELPTVIEEDPQDDLAEHEHLLWAIMEFFGFTGSKHDPERLKIIRKKGD